MNTLPRNRMPSPALLLLPLVFAGLPWNSTVIAQADHAKAHCEQVAGTIMTNLGVITENTTLGTATGDLRGAVSATILQVSPAGDGSITFSVQHHWVTEAGETLTFAPVDIVTAPVGQGIFGATAPSPLFLTGGTGRFERATGALAAFGAADLTRGQTVFRYSGEVCLKSRG